MSEPSTTIIVVAAVIERDGRFLLTRRLEGTHLAGYWEFPGGKCDSAESHRDCLVRELREELNVTVAMGRLVLSTSHAYPDRTVDLYFYQARIDDEPQPQLGQEMRWASRAELASLDFPQADAVLIQLLVGG